MRSIFRRLNRYPDRLAATFCFMIIVVCLSLLPAAISRRPMKSAPSIRSYGDCRSNWILVRTAISHEGHSYAVVEVVHESVKYFVLRVDGSSVLLGSEDQFPEESE